MAQLIKNWEVCFKASCPASINLVNMDVDIIYHRVNIRNVFGPALKAMIKLSLVLNSLILNRVSIWYFHRNLLGTLLFSICINMQLEKGKQTHH